MGSDGTCKHLPRASLSFTRYTGFRWGSGSPINWLYWLTRCGPQPLQPISASWYGPMHHLGLCALPMFRCSSFLAYTPNWPVALFLLLLHLYLLTFDCAKTFSLSNATWKPICSNSLSPPVLCCIKRLSIFGPKGAIQIRYYYYYYY